MSYFKVFMAALACIIVLVSAGCGGKNVNGSLTVDSTLDSAETTALVTFSVQYTNPQVTDLINTKVDYQLFVDGTSYGSGTQYTNNSGAFSIGFAFDRSAADQVIKFVARTGDLESIESVIIPGLGKLAVSEGVVDLTSTTSASVTISGGLPPYNTTVPSVSGITAQISGGDTLLFFKNSITVTTHGTTTVTVTDSSTPAQSLIVSIIY